MSFRPTTSAFTLVEMAIVLVILGLLAGAIMAGQALVQSAALQRTIKFQMNIKNEFEAFRDKYQAFPGDIPNATSFWGVSSVAAMNCTTQPGTSNATGTCNGDGDGYITWNGGGGNGENYNVIQHLELAGMDATPLAGGYVFPATPGPYWQTPGQTSNAISYIGGTSPFADQYEVAAPRGNTVNGIAIQTAATCSTYANGGAATPADVQYMDNKIDDGLPNSGIFYGANASPQAVGVGACLFQTMSCLVASGSTYIYNAATKTQACRFMLLLVAK